MRACVIVREGRSGGGGGGWWQLVPEGGISYEFGGGGGGGGGGPQAYAEHNQRYLYIISGTILAP